MSIQDELEEGVEQAMKFPDVEHAEWRENRFGEGFEFSATLNGERYIWDIHEVDRGIWKVEGPKESKRIGEGVGWHLGLQVKEIVQSKSSRLCESCRTAGRPPHDAAEEAFEDINDLLMGLKHSTALQEVSDADRNIARKRKEAVEALREFEEALRDYKYYV